MATAADLRALDAKRMSDLAPSDYAARHLLQRSWTQKWREANPEAAAWLDAHPLPDDTVCDTCSMSAAKGPRRVKRTYDWTRLESDPPGDPVIGARCMHCRKQHGKPQPPDTALTAATKQRIEAENAIRLGLLDRIVAANEQFRPADNRGLDHVYVTPDVEGNRPPADTDDDDDGTLPDRSAPRGILDKFFAAD